MNKNNNSVFRIAAAAVAVTTALIVAASLTTTSNAFALSMTIMSDMLDDAGDRQAAEAGLPGIKSAYVGSEDLYELNPFTNESTTDHENFTLTIFGYDGDYAVSDLILNFALIEQVPQGLTAVPGGTEIVVYNQTANIKATDFKEYRACPLTCSPEIEFRFSISADQLDPTIPQPTTEITEVPITFNTWIAKVTTPDGKTITDITRDQT